MTTLVSFFATFLLVVTFYVVPASAHTADAPYKTDLLAGKSTDAGDILVWNDQENLYIKYVATGGWCITETHLHVGEALSEIPQTRKGNPIPGKFTYKDSFDPCVIEAPYTIPLEDWGPSTELYIAAKADVSNGSMHLTAWADGSRFPWKSWAMYFTYTIQGVVPGNASITIKKYTNGEDADTPPGPSINVGSAVTWTYVVTNTGDVDLTDVTVTDDKGVTVTCPKSAPITLVPDEVMECKATGTAVAGQYVNKGTATGTPSSGSPVTAEDLSHYMGVQQGPAITMKKYTNGDDADAPPGPSINVGDPVTWKYVVTNTGGVDLTDVTVTDDKGVAVTCPKSAPITLTPDEKMECEATGTAVAGQYVNKGTVTGTPPSGPQVTAEDLSHYYGEGAVAILEVTANPNLLWPPNHKMVPVTINVTFTGSSVTPTCEIVSVASNEPENGLGDGDTSPDWEITGGLTLNLRAERGGAGNGRIYTITVKCTDAQGSIEETTEVTVPHDRGKKK